MLKVRIEDIILSAFRDSALADTSIVCLPAHPGAVHRNNKPMDFYQLERERREQILWASRVLASHIRILLLCTKQEIATSSHTGTLETMSRGNFVEVSAFIRKKCSELAADAQRHPKEFQLMHLSLRDNAVQDELIQICESLVLQKIKDEVQESSCFVILVGETEDCSGTEYVSVHLRYVRKTEVVERFIGFFKPKDLDGTAISDGIIAVVQRGDFDFDRCVAQSFDGAQVMSLSADGIKSRISSCVGTDCPEMQWHFRRLESALVDSCTVVPEVRELVGLLQAIQDFQSESVRRARYFERAQERLHQKVLRMPQSSDPRWCTEREGISFFKDRFKAIADALKDIVKNGKADEAFRCNSYMREFQSFKTVLLLVILDKALDKVHPFSSYLRTSDIIFTAFVESYTVTISGLERLRSAEFFQSLWSEAEAIAKTTSSPTRLNLRLPKEKPEKTTSKKTGVSVVEKSAGSCDSQALFFRIIDTIVAEIVWFAQSDETFLYLETADPGSENFLKKERVEEFCRKFHRLRIDSVAISAQLSVAKKLVLAKELKTPRECLDYFLRLKEGFVELVLFFKIMSLFSARTVAGEKYVNTGVKSYLWSAMGESKTSALALLAIERDLTEFLSDNLEQAFHRQLSQ